MINAIIQKLKAINPWHFLWISVIASEIFALLLTVMFSLLFFGRVYSNILLVVAFDAFFVPLLVAPVVIYSIKETTKLAELNELLQKTVNEQKRTENLLVRSKQDWEDTFNTITDIITIHDRDFNIIRANRAAEQLLQLPDVQSHKAIKCFRHYHGTDCPPEGCPSCDCLKTGNPASFELFEPHLKMFIEIRAIARLNEKKEIIGLIHVVRDITERRKIEDTVKNAKAEWETTFDNASELIALVNKDVKILRCNKSFAEFVSKPIRDLAGYNILELIPIDQKQIQPGMPATKTEVKTNNGEWLYISYYPILNEKEEFLRGVVVCTDITDLKYTQDKLIQSEKELQERVAELEDFYNMSIGRELKMKELKEKNKQFESYIKKLETKITDHKN